MPLPSIPLPRGSISLFKSDVQPKNALFIIFYRLGTMQTNKKQGLTMLKKITLKRISILSCGC